MKPVQTALQPGVEGTYQQTLSSVPICLLLMLHQLHIRAQCHSLIQLDVNSGMSVELQDFRLPGKSIRLLNTTRPLSTLGWTACDCPALCCTNMLLDHVTSSSLPTICTGSVNDFPQLPPVGLIHRLNTHDQNLVLGQVISSITILYTTVLHCHC